MSRRAHRRGPSARALPGADAARGVAPPAPAPSPLVRFEAVPVASPEAGAGGRGPVQRRPGGGPVAGSAMDLLPIQRLRYASRAANRFHGAVDVTEEGRTIRFAGALTPRVGGPPVEAKGSVEASRYTFPADRLTHPTPAAAHAPATALRVQLLSAEPRGVALGQVLTWHVARKAEQEHVPDVVALDVVPGARTGFYEPMGFEDFDPRPERHYRTLEANRAAIGEWLGRPEVSTPGNPMYLPPAEFDDLVRERGELLERMVQSPMRITAAALEANSQARWGGLWRQGDDPAE